MIGFDGRGRAQEMTEWAQRFEQVELPEAREAPEVDRHKYAELAASAVEKLWCVKFERYRNTFTEIGGRRLLQVSRGKRVRDTSNFIFTITHEANARFEIGNWEVWFALVPMSQAPWSGGRKESRQIPVKFDVQEGKVLEGRQWAVRL